MTTINSGKRETQIWADKGECDICDERGPVVVLLMPNPFGSLNICRGCLSILSAELWVSE